MKIAVVGAGVSGLVCALGLSRKHEVTVLEAAARPGGHAHTAMVDDNGRSIGIDTGFIVFNYAHYPHLTKLFERFDVKSQPSDMSFSVRCDKTGFEFSGSNFDTFFAQRRNLLRPDAWRLLFAIFSFNRDAKQALQQGLSDQMSVADFAQMKGYSSALVERYLLPLGGALWSSSVESFSRFPIRFFLEFLNNHAMLQIGNRPLWRTVTGGSTEYVGKVAKTLGSRLRLDQSVRQIAREGNHVMLHVGHESPERFDEVVLATHADTALQLVADPEADEQQVLASFPYQDNVVNLHTDTRVLPRSTRAWASWNYRIPATSHSDGCVSYNMNKLQALDCETTYCVSLNQESQLDPKKILRREIVRHPMFIPGRDEAQARQSELIRRRGVSYCGAYWGFGFHEDGVRSALAVCDAFDVERPC